MDSTPRPTSLSSPRGVSSGISEPRKKVNLGQVGSFQAPGSESSRRVSVEPRTEKIGQILNQVKGLESTLGERIAAFFGHVAESSIKKRNALRNSLEQSGLQLNPNVETRILEGRLNAEDLQKLETAADKELRHVEQQIESFKTELAEKPVASFTGNITDNSVFKGRLPSDPVSEQFLQVLKLKMYDDGNIPKAVVASTNPRVFTFYFDDKQETVTVNTVKDLDRLDNRLKECATKSTQRGVENRPLIDLGKPFGDEEQTRLKLFADLERISERNDNRGFFAKLRQNYDENRTQAADLKADLEALNVPIPADILEKLNRGSYLNDREIVKLKSDVASTIRMQLFNKALESHPVASFEQTGQLIEAYGGRNPTDSELHELKLFLTRECNIPAVMGSRSNPREFVIYNKLTSKFEILTINKAEDLHKLQTFLMWCSGESKKQVALVSESRRAEVPTAVDLAQVTSGSTPPSQEPAAPSPRPLNPFLEGQRANNPFLNQLSSGGPNPFLAQPPPPSAPVSPGAPAPNPFLTPSTPSVPSSGGSLPPPFVLPSNESQPATPSNLPPPATNPSFFTATPSVQSSKLPPPPVIFSSNQSEFKAPTSPLPTNLPPFPSSVPGAPSPNKFETQMPLPPPSTNLPSPQPTPQVTPESSQTQTLKSVPPPPSEAGGMKIAGQGGIQAPPPPPLKKPPQSLKKPTPPSSETQTVAPQSVGTPSTKMGMLEEMQNKQLRPSAARKPEVEVPDEQSLEKTLQNALASHRTDIASGGKSKYSFDAEDETFKGLSSDAQKQIEAAYRNISTAANKKDAESVYSHLIDMHELWDWKEEE